MTKKIITATPAKSDIAPPSTGDSEFYHLLADIEDTIERLDDTGNWERKSIAVMHKGIVRAYCDGKPHNVATYRSILDRIEGTDKPEIDNMKQYAMAVPKFVHDLDDKLCNIKIDDDPTPKPSTNPLHNVRSIPSSFSRPIVRD